LPAVARNNSTGSADSSGGLPGAKEMDKMTGNSGMAESKQDGDSPQKRKVKRRVSAKAVDNTWAVKSNVPYRQLAKSLAGGAVSEEAESKGDDEVPKEEPEINRMGSIGSTNSTAASSIRESIVEEEDEEDEREAEEVAAEEVATEEVEGGGALNGETLPPAPPEVAEEERHLSYEAACGYTTTLVKLNQMIQDACTEQSRKGWYYLNAENGEEGPFHSEWMHSWLNDKALNGDTQIRCGDGMNFILLSSMVPGYDEVTMESPNPFGLSWGGEVQNSVEVLEKLSQL